MRIAVLIVALGVLGGCTAPSYQRPTTEAVSVLDLREAKKAVKVYETVPPGATQITTVDAMRCKKRGMDVDPDEEMITNDLMVAALARDATGIAEFEFNIRGPNRYGCAHLGEGSAKAFVAP
ncbi:hypothetical protein [Pusillimonas sp. ANT_WB101]|uniref:hypothetical protein n=1 Tax=Pusillimonas sp. ANT_WB101 TaxID=2597356 RepID=UPI0011EE9E39|nr:hypothetical protein [Pusillimonas sp. ANT_WB101]KAA0910656.1 hypothetical protein FQ179_01910 [Pusillimonas sp. ANT_WB101]